MKDNYGGNVSLRRTVCGSNDCFDSNEDNTYIKCTCCNIEYHGGYDELVECNQELIDQEVENVKEEIGQDLHNEISDIFKKAFKGCKNIKLK